MLISAENKNHRHKVFDELNLEELTKKAEYELFCSL